jgi:hypothetical protein
MSSIGIGKRVEMFERCKILGRDWRLGMLNAPGNNQSDVVGLLVWTEPLNVSYNGRNQVERSKLAMPPQQVDQPLFAKLFSGAVAGFRDAVGVERERVSVTEFAFGDRAFPIFEQS